MTEHECDTPTTAMPGQYWRCDECGAEYMAWEDDANDYGAFFHWEPM